VTAPVSVRVAVVLHRTDRAVLERLLRSLAVAVARARAEGSVSDVTVHLGDSTPNSPPGSAVDSAVIMEKSGAQRPLGTGFLHDHREAAAGLDVRYDAFGENLWHSGGTNRLLDGLTEDAALLLNPDLLLAPDAVDRLVRALGGDRVGIADARQLPFEHPKPHDPVTGDVPWASMAACAVRRETWEEVGPLDAEWFPMHGNDVDFSWRARLAGWRVVHVPGARVVHDKRLTSAGSVAPSEVEEEHGARAALLLAVKYSRPDVAERHFATLESGTPAQRRGAAAVRSLLSHTALPPLLDPDHLVAEFVGGDFAAHRF